MRQWFKVSSTLCDDPDFEYLQAMNPNIGLVWIWLLCDCARRDSWEVRQLQPRQIEQVCKRLGIDPQSYSMAMNALEEVGWIEDGKVRSWDKWQSPTDKTNAERQKRYRDRQKDREIERETDREIEVTSRNALRSVTQEPNNHPSPSQLIIWDKELEAVNKKITTIRGNYEGMQEWSADDSHNIKQLKARRQELMGLVARKY